MAIPEPTTTRSLLRSDPPTERCDLVGRGLILQFYDTEEPHTLTGRTGANGSIMYDYQAEMWVQEQYNDPYFCDERPHRWVVKWILFGLEGTPRACWERAPGDKERPILTWASEDFTGEWKVGT